MPSGTSNAPPPDPVAVLIGWHAEGFDLAAARNVVTRTVERLELVPVSLGVPSHTGT